MFDVLFVFKIVFVILILISMVLLFQMDLSSYFGFQEKFTNWGNLCDYQLDSYQKQCLMKKNNLNENELDDFWKTKCKQFKNIEDIDCDIDRPNNVNILETAATLKARGKPVHPLYYETERHSIGTPFEKDANGVFGTKWSDNKTGRNSYWGYGPQGDWRIQSTTSDGLVKVQEFGGQTVIGTNVPDSDAALTVDGGSLVSRGPMVSHTNMRAPDMNTGILSFYSNILGQSEATNNLKKAGSISIAAENDNSLIIDPVSKLILKGPVILDQNGSEINIGDKFGDIENLQKEMSTEFQSRSQESNENLKGVSIHLDETKKNLDALRDNFEKKHQNITEKVSSLETTLDNKLIKPSTETNESIIIQESDKFCVDDVCLKGKNREICIGNECLNENMLKNINKFIETDRLRVGDTQILKDEIRIGKADLREEKWCMGSHCLNTNDIKKIND